MQVVCSHHLFSEHVEAFKKEKQTNAYLIVFLNDPVFIVLSTFIDQLNQEDNATCSNYRLEKQEIKTLCWKARVDLDCRC